MNAEAVTTSFDYDFDFGGLEQGGSSAQLKLLGGFGIGYTLFMLAIAVLTILSMWKIFVKAGKPGWASLVPIYNLWVLLEISGFSGWFVLLPGLVPILAAIKLPEKFGKGAAYIIGLIFVPFVFYPMLAFGNAQYEGAEVIVEEPVE